MWNRHRLTLEVTVDRETTLKWCQNNFLLYSSRQCQQHKCEMKYYINRGRFGTFRCPKHKQHYSGHRGEISAATGTWFAKHHLDVNKAFSLMMSFCDNDSYEKAKKEAKFDDSECSSETICDWYNYCREIIVAKFIEKQENKGLIGGSGKIVQIDEAKFGRRKYQRGRLVEGHWLLGMIEDKSEDFRLEMCPNNQRTTEVLIPLIQKHVATGSIVHTDEWRAYNKLARCGYIHKTVNHSKEFVAVDGTHTQRIEANWRPMRQYFRGRHIPDESFADHVVEYQWRRWIRKNNKNSFEELLSYIKKLYPINI